jgi:hypothetical protein
VAKPVVLETGPESSEPDHFIGFVRFAPNDAAIYQAAIGQTGAPGAILAMSARSSARLPVLLRRPRLETGGLLRFLEKD